MEDDDAFTAEFAARRGPGNRNHRLPDVRRIRRYAGRRRSRSCRSSPKGEALPAVEVDKVDLSDDAWKAKLSPASYYVARHAGTERPFTGPLLNEHGTGIFGCVCCSTALFSSTTKFDSGTGWPSFWKPIAKENVREKTDSTLGMERTEVLCTRCDGPSGPCLRRRAAADRPALLHEFRVDEFHRHSRLRENETMFPKLTRQTVFAGIALLAAPFVATTTLRYALTGAIVAMPLTAAVAAPHSRPGQRHAAGGRSRQFKGCAVGRLLLGRAGRIPARQRRHARDIGLFGRIGEHRAVRDGQHRHDRARGVGRDHL